MGRFLVPIVLYFLAAAGAWAAEVHDVRLWRAPDHTRIVFDLSGPASHKLMVLSNPSRVVLDIEDTHLKVDLSGLELLTVLRERQIGYGVVVLTGQLDVDTVLQIPSDLPHRHLAKPCDADVFLKAVAEMATLQSDS